MRDNAMKEEFKNFLKITKNIKVRAYQQGILFFDRETRGGMGYLVRKGKVLKIPVTLEVLTK